MHFDPSEQQMKQQLTQMRSLMDRILGRPEVEEEQKKIVSKALEELKQEGLSFREAQAIQMKAFDAIGFGGFMRRGRGRGAAVAEPGTYAVKLTVNGKSYTSTITVRRDPLLN
jgi:hypothetical protein